MEIHLEGRLPKAPAAALHLAGRSCNDLRRVRLRHDPTDMITTRRTVPEKIGESRSMSARKQFPPLPRPFEPHRGASRVIKPKMRGAVSIIEFLKLITRPMPATLAAVVCAVKIALQLPGYDFGVDRQASEPLKDSDGRR